MLKGDKMKVLVYVNKEKDYENKILIELQSALKKEDIEYDITSSEEFDVCNDYSALFVIGGDGTILRRTKIANMNDIPIIGINAGKLGFLSEFEPNDVENAVKSIKNNQLVLEEKTSLKVVKNGKTYYALNDIVLQKIYVNNAARTTIDVDMIIDGVEVDSFNCDGVIVSTPTGSTAYSLSAGGAILAPNVEGLIITPISPHSFSHRPVIISSKSTCGLKYKSGSSCGVFADGKMVFEVEPNEIVDIQLAEKPTKFYRKKDYNFFNRLSKKLKDRRG